MVSSNPSFLHTITAAVVFGSALSETEELGDVDVAVQLERKPMDWETYLRSSNERVTLAQQNGKRFGNITEQVCWPTIEIWNFLESRTRQLSIHDLDELNRFPKVKCRVLFGYRQVLAELLPNAEIVR